MAEGTTPIVARIVIDDSGITGLGGKGGGDEQDPDSKIKSVSKLLRSLLGIQKLILAQSVGGLLKKILTPLLKVIPPALSIPAAGAAVIAGGAGALIGGVGKGLAAMDGEGAITEEQARVVREAFGITEEEILAINEGLNKGQQTITKDIVPTEQKVAEEWDRTHEVLIDNTGKLTVIEKKTDEITDAMQSAIDAWADYTERIYALEVGGAPGFGVATPKTIIAQINYANSLNVGGGATPEEWFSSTPGGVPNVPVGGVEVI